MQTDRAQNRRNQASEGPADKESTQSGPRHTRNLHKHTKDPGRKLTNLTEPERGPRHIRNLHKENPEQT